VRSGLSSGRLVVFGAGGGAEHFCTQTGERPDFFVDNDPEKWGEKFLGIQILPPEHVLAMDVERILITSGYVGSILSQLQKMGVPTEKVEIPPKYLLGNPTIFSRVENRKSAAETLFSLMTIPKLPASVVALGGAALGFCRESDFILWDCDVDLIAPLQGRDQIATYARSRDWQIVETEKNILCEVILGESERLPVSFVFYDLNCPIYIDTFDTYEWKWPIKMFTECEVIEIHGFKLNVPGDSENYLKQVYGESWRVPRKDFSYLDYAPT